MSKKRKTIRRWMNLIMAISLGTCIFLGASSITYALINQDKPDVVVHIDENGKITQSGDMYEGALWYPGFSKSGIVRVVNNFKRIKVSDLGLEVDINNVDRDNPVYDSFLDNMILTISRGKMLVFNDILVKGKSLSELLANADSDYNNLQLDGSQQFYIEKGDTVDLKYELYMDTDSGDELENLTAKMAFCVNLNEIPTPPDDGNNDGDDDDDDDRDKDDREYILVEEPSYIIPDIDGHWAHDCIIALIENDVLDPDSENRIRPDDYLTRAEAAVLMGRALKLEESKETDTGYVDYVPSWARGYVIATSKANVFRGYPGKIFKSFGNITREEMTAVLIRAFREDSVSNAKLSFTDEHMIAKWAYGNVAKSVEEGIITGYPEDNTFRPKAYITRAEAFTIVCKLLGYHEQHKIKL